jgi:signal-transduction protein with cAMP-binding, CBS, and nucleotidyltransferase domain
MEKHGLHHLLVVEHGRMAGILSSADLLKLALLLPENETLPSALTIRVRDVMQPRVAVVRENTSLKETARALTLGGFHALPVLALDDTPVGIVTSSDLLGLLIEQLGRDTGTDAADAPTTPSGQGAALPRLLDVLRAAEVYLHSGQSDQQHARLTRAVSMARESLDLNAPARAC